MQEHAAILVVIREGLEEPHHTVQAARSCRRDAADAASPPARLLLLLLLLLPGGLHLRVRESAQLARNL